MSDLKQRNHYDLQLQQLHQDVIDLGNMVDEAVRKSLAALRYRDRITAEKICAEDQRINEKRFEIEKEGLIIIATQQPMARDLRFLAAVLEIITELERMGDYAKGIARINLRLDDQANQRVPIEELEEMASLGLDMLRRALLAFQERNAEEARLIPGEDDLLDYLYNQVFEDLIQQTRFDSSALYQVNLILWAAHNLERLGDRVTNICERIIFWVNGDMQELDGSGCGPE
jgi:phosphate transport system protein